MFHSKSYTETIRNTLEAAKELLKDLFLRRVHTCNDAVYNSCKLFLAGPSIGEHRLANISATSVSHSAPVGPVNFKHDMLIVNIVN